MHETGIKLLKLMFREGETICVSHNEYGYHSIPLENAISEKVVLVPTEESCIKRDIPWNENAYEHKFSDELLLVALNPIKGWRNDQSCYKYRNFLVEMDTGTIESQMKYIEDIGMPYSAAVFSGNKSLHFLISLEEDLPSEDVYRLFSVWINGKDTGIVTLGDHNCVNPSRSIRIPGAYREPKKQQTLYAFKGPVKTKDLVAWLNKYPNSRPQPQKKREVYEGEVEFKKVKQWTIDRLKNGLKGTMGRNKEWFAIACEFALAGYSEDDTIAILGKYFSPDRDFKEKEWMTAIKSAFKHIYERKRHV